MYSISKILGKEFKEVGFIKKTKGFEGNLQVQFIRKINKHKPYQTILLIIDNTEIPFQLEEFELTHSNTGLIKLKEVDNFEYASELLHCKVYFEISSISNDDETINEKYNHYQVLDEKRGLIGSIIHMEENRYNTLMHIEQPDGKSVIIPYHDDYIKKIDEDNQTIMVILPEGYEIFFE